jgi:hypothetical protein
MWINLLKLALSSNNGPIQNMEAMFQTWKNVTTLALGLWPKQTFTRVQAKKEAQESHLTLLGV